MKTAEEWMDNTLLLSGTYWDRLERIKEIQSDAFKAGQEATMKWVGEECKKQTERLIEMNMEGGVVSTDTKLKLIARSVVDARHYHGDDGWDKLKNAICELEGIVGRTQLTSYPAQ